jgi:hypothetical protein
MRKIGAIKKQRRKHTPKFKALEDATPDEVYGGVVKLAA